MNEGLHQFLNIYAKGEIERFGYSGSPESWLDQFICYHYTPQGTGKRAFVLLSASTESLIFDLAAKGELEFGGSLPDELGELLVQKSATDHDCDSVARSLVLRAAVGQWALPTSMHDFARAVAIGSSPPKKQGDRYYKIRTRNLIGAAALIVLTNEQHGFGLNGTKGAERKERAQKNAPKCACDLLVDATKGANLASITTSAADEIWRNRERLWTEWKVQMGIFALRVDGKIINARAAIELVRQLDQMGTSGPSGRKAKNQPDD